MAYQAHRWNENAAGMTGHGRVAMYDGSGSGANEGGDSFADIVAPGFFDGQEEVEDAVRRASEGITTGNGLSIIIQGHDKTAIDVLYDNAGTLTMRGGAWRIPNGRT